MRAFVTRQLPGRALESLTGFCDLDVWPGEGPPDRETLIDRAAEADGLLCMLTDRIDAALLERCPRLRVVSNMAVGVDNVDLAAAARLGVAVGNTPDVLTDATADLTMTLLLAAARRLPEGVAAVREGTWGPWRPDWLLGLELRGARLAIVGMGRIGGAVAERARAFGMEIVHAGRPRTAQFEQALSTADVVTLHCPLTPETRGLIDDRLLAGMKRGAILVNTARGAIVDQGALGRALREGHLGGAALDVTDPEPLPPDHPLLAEPRLIVLPHLGSATHRTRERMAQLAVANLRAGLEGDPLPHAVVAAADGVSPSSAAAAQPTPERGA
jgi:lactate dehydrogenase-like 2-hydroxyacid dehydrogenase